MKLSRRSFMKANAVAAAAAAAGLSVPGVARAVVGQQEAIKWDKAPCRFCGTGCGVLVGTQQGLSLIHILTLPTNSIVCRSRWSPYH